MSVFAHAHLPGWDALPPDLRREFEEADLPASFLEPGTQVYFEAGPDLIEVDVPGLGSRMLRFGRGTGEHYYRDPGTGNVFIADDDDGAAAFVNSGLAELGATMRLVTSLSQQILHGDPDDVLDAAGTFRRELSAIDKPAASVLEYWGAFGSDFEAGDYSDHLID